MFLHLIIKMKFLGLSGCSIEANIKCQKNFVLNFNIKPSLHNQVLNFFFLK